METEENKETKMYLTELILIALLCALNVSVDLIISPPLKILFGHIITGIFLMVPINFIFISFAKLMVDKFGSISLYLTIFGI